MLQWDDIHIYSPGDTDKTDNIEEKRTYVLHADTIVHMFRRAQGAVIIGSIF